ncbi:MAG: endolytic transglycosylase MltG [Proteobacteria bacterium]|nr:endolytic transglycosylase MltG [Pseudomonadota bacterium]
MKRKFLWLTSFLVSGLLIFVFFYLYYIKSPLGLEEDKLFEVKKGETGIQIINNLSNEGIIKNKFLFRIMVKIKGGDKRIIPGFYLARKNESPESFWSRLLQGDVEKYKLVIPEGYNIYQIAQVVENVKLGSAKRFLELVKDKKFIASLGYDLPSLEGYLFPSTYYFMPKTKEEDVIKEMFNKTFEVLYKEIGIPEKMPKKEIHKILTYASMIEKEAKVKEEMPLISAVFHNRIRKGMKLQCDPTVIYGLKNFNGDLTKKDLYSKHPYNTYLYYGLPPTPIANPSKEAIIAAYKPAQVDYLYFVSRNDGTHIFSKSLKEHNSAVYKFQKKNKREES